MSLVTTVRRQIKNSVPKETFQILRAAFRPIRIIINFFTRLRAGFGISALDEQWGSGRGLPIIRYYLEQFLDKHRADIHGHCLEFHNDDYASRYGGDRIKRLDIMHLDETNPHATIVADLTKRTALADNLFDCIIFTHVLHGIYDLKAAVRELHRLLKPGGVLLVAVPQISMCSTDYPELWRFTVRGLHLLLGEIFGMKNVEVTAYGNSLSAAANIRGLAAHELSHKELDQHDSRFASEICARALKV